MFKPISGASIVESRTGKVVRMSTRSDIDWQLSKIPAELHPAVNRIALELAHAMGWDCDTDLIDFVNSDDVRAVGLVHLALVAMCELQDFCLDFWGTTLEELVDREDK